MDKEQQIWDSYNELIAGPDVERIRKLLARYELFEKSLHVPGDIVEAGVFKGTGLLYFLKLLHIFAPGSAKRVVGFDLFGGFDAFATGSDREAVLEYVAESGSSGSSVDTVMQLVRDAGFDESRCELVPGDETVESVAVVSQRNKDNRSESWKITIPTMACSSVTMLLDTPTSTSA